MNSMTNFDSNKPIKKNHLIKGTKAYHIRSADGLASPNYYFLDLVGLVTKVKRNSGDSNSIYIGEHHYVPVVGEEMFLRPDLDGSAYYFAELDNMGQYLIEDGSYKVPVGVCKKHIATYIAPWEDDFSEWDDE
jgi:hypothetical protein